MTSALPPQRPDRIRHDRERVQAGADRTKAAIDPATVADANPTSRSAPPHDQRLAREPIVAEHRKPGQHAARCETERAVPSVVAIRHYVPVDRARPVPMLEIMRYAQGASRIDVELDGYLNYHFVTTPADISDAPRLMLEAGINPAAMIHAPDGPRRPLIGLRSSPWKAGHVTNPWHDEFDLDHGHVRYYGDHKPTTIGLPGATAGNRALLDAWALHAATDARDRLQAPPLLV
jgi:hypothetical protein